MIMGYTIKKTQIQPLRHLKYYIRSMKKKEILNTNVRLSLTFVDCNVKTNYGNI